MVVQEWASHVFFFSPVGGLGLWWRHEVRHLILAEKWEREKAMWKEAKRERERERGIWNLTKKEREISIVGFGVVRERMVGCERWRVTVLTSLISN